MKYDAITKAAIEHVAASGKLSSGPTLVALREALEAKHPGAIERARDRRAKERFERRFIGPVPDWAKRYVAKYGSGLVDTLTVRQSRVKGYTSGHCYGDRLVVTFSARSSDPETEKEREIERRVVVLHEIAHALARWDGHGDRFYAEQHRLLAAEGLVRKSAERHGTRRVTKGRRAAADRR